MAALMPAPWEMRPAGSGLAQKRFQRNLAAEGKSGCCTFNTSCCIAVAPVSVCCTPPWHLGGIGTAVDVGVTWGWIIGGRQVRTGALA